MPVNYFEYPNNTYLMFATKLNKYRYFETWNLYKNSNILTIITIYECYNG